MSTKFKTSELLKNINNINDFNYIIKNIFNNINPIDDFI